MSVLDSLNPDLFEQLLWQLDKAKAAPQRHRLNDEAIIQEINRLAEELLPREQPPPLMALEQSAVLFQVGVGTNESSFLEDVDPKKQASQSVRGVLNRLGSSGVTLKKQELNLDNDSQRMWGQSTNSKKITRKLVASTKTFAPAQCNRLHEEAKTRLSHKTSAFITKQIKVKAAEDAAKVSSTATRNSNLENKQNTSGQGLSKIQEVRIKSLVREENERLQLSLERSRVSIDKHSSSLERPRRSIYERAQLNRIKKEETIASIRQEKQLREVSELKEPSINRSVEVQGGFEKRLALTNEKKKFNKALLLQKQLERNTYHPRLISTGWKVQSKVKALWAKPPREEESLWMVREDKEQAKSLNSTAVEPSKNMTLIKPKQPEEPGHRTIEIKFANDLDFLLN